MKLKHVLLALFSVSILVSCDKEAVKVPAGITLEGADEIGLLKLDFAYTAGEQTITFEADGRWEIDIPDECHWLTATPSSGETKGKETVSVVLAAQENPEYEGRTAVVYLLCNDREQRDFLNITQEKSFFREVKLSHSNATVTASAADYKLSVLVTNLDDWTPSSTVPWVSFKKNSLEELVVSVLQNTAGVEREAEVKLTSTCEGKDYTSTIVLHQLAVKAEADMLDLVFHDDCTAEDVSSAHRHVYSHLNPDKLSVKKDDMLGYNVACMSHDWGLYGKEGGAYTIADDDMKAQFNDGFTLETYIKPGQDPTEKEMKIISSTRGGGYALMHSNSRGYCFLINGSSKGGKNTYYWTQSDVKAQKDVWVHLVATFDKPSGVCRIYLNGKKKAETTVPELVMHYSSLGSHSYMTVGGNSNSNESTAETPNLYAMVNGTIAVARVYSQALSEEQIPATVINLLPGKIQLYD